MGIFAPKSDCKSMHRQNPSASYGLVDKRTLNLRRSVTTLSNRKSVVVLYCVRHPHHHDIIMINNSELKDNLT